MICKRCPYCHRDSYSAYDDPDWKCPYCSANIGSDRRSVSGVSAKKNSRIRGVSDIRNEKVINFVRIKEQLAVIEKN